MPAWKETVLCCDDDDDSVSEEEEEEKRRGKKRGHKAFTSQSVSATCVRKEGRKELCSAAAPPAEVQSRTE